MPDETQPVSAPAGTSTAAANAGMVDVDRMLTLSDSDFATEFGMDDLTGGESPAGEGGEGGTPEKEGWQPLDDKADKADKATADADVDLPPDEPPADGEPEGDGDGEPPKGRPEKAERKLAAEFAVYQGEDAVETPTDVKIKFKASGKERFLPLDQVVRLAQNGFHNQELQERVERFESKVPELEQQIEAFEDERSGLLSTIRRLVTDDDYLAEVRERVEAQNTPEARASRYEREIEILKQERERDRGMVMLREFVAQRIVPHFETLLSAYPTVKVDELQEKLLAHASRLRNRQGYVPREAFPKLLALIEDEVAPWASKLHQDRLDAEEARQARDKTRRTQEQERQRKRLATRVLRPGSRVAPKAPQRREEHMTADEAAAAVVAEAFGG